MERLGYNGAEEIKAHPWFEPINWDMIINKQVKPPYRPQLEGARDTKHFPDEFTRMKMSPAESSFRGSAADDGLAAGKWQGFSYANSQLNSIKAHTGISSQAADIEMQTN